MATTSYIRRSLFLFLVIASAFRLFSQSLPKEYSCYKAPSQIIIDGDVYDNVWKSVPWSDFFVDIEGSAKPAPYHHTRMKMLWDDDYLYIAAELEEPHIWGYLNKHDDIIYRDNDFEVFIDPTSTGKNYFEIEINSIGTVLDLYMNKPYKKGGSADISWNAEGLKSAVKIYGSNNDSIGSDIKWTVEMAIPWTVYTNRVNAISIPENGESWRINFSRVQWETDFCDGRYKKKINPETGVPLQENNWVWSPQGLINMHVPEHWGVITFSNKYPEVNSRIWTEDGYPRMWVWMGGNSTYSDKDWDAVFRKLDDAGITGFLFGGDTNQLNKVLCTSKHYDIKVHAWFWTMNRGDAKPEWLSYNQLGQSLANKKAYVGYYKFMCPALPEVRNFIKTKMSELILVEGLEGIHMDYIRYVDVILPLGLQPKYGLVQDHIMPEFDYGYHPYMRNLYKEKHGIDPIKLPDPGIEKQWIDFRLEQLNTAIDSLRTFVKNRNLNITAAVFPTPQMSADMVRQDWSDWQLDCYFPMVYHNFYNEPISWIENVMKENRRVIGNDSKLYCGIYLPALQEGSDLTDAITAAYNGGADGVSFFSYGNLNGPVIKQIKNFTHHD